MMKKSRKTAGNQTPSTASYQVAADDMARAKIRTLTQDYEGLIKETEAMKNRLQAAKMKKQNLLAQVKFLRKKYRSFVGIPQKNSVYQLNYDSQQTGPSTTQSHLQSQRISPAYGAPPQNLGTRTEFARKGKNHNDQETEVSTTRATFDLNQSAFNPSKQQPHQRISPATVACDLHARDMNYRGKEISAPSMSGMLDLNQAAMPAVEEVEYRSAWEASSWERPAKQFTLEADRAAADLKLAVCRNVGKTSSRSGKRKISWQDQVVLRV